MAEIVVVNIGNSNTQIAVASGGELDSVKLFFTSGLTYRSEFRKFAALMVGRPWFVGSVVPDASQEIKALVGMERTHFLTAEMISDLDFSMVDASTIGADRLANAVGGVAAVGAPVIVVDCGTAITTEVVDRARRFRGGTIMPGRGLQRKVLEMNTGLLPNVEMTVVCPDVPGTQTSAAIAAGVDVGLVGALQRILADTRAAIGEPECPILVVGGDAAYFAEALPELALGGADLTLRGMALIAPDALLVSDTDTEEM